MFLQGKEVRFALVLLVLAGLTYAQELKECKNSTDLKNGCVKTTTTPYGSKIITPYKNGKINGIQQIYNAENKLEQETPYVNNKIEGLSKGYDNEGRVRSITPYKNGKINGVEKLYYKNKILKKETPYKNGKINGFVRGYYENGKPEFILFYTNGKKDRGGKWYDSKGKILAEFIYKRDKATVGRCYQKKMMSKKQLQRYNASPYTSTLLSICKR